MVLSSLVLLLKHASTHPFSLTAKAVPATGWSAGPLGSLSHPVLPQPTLEQTQGPSLLLP